MSFETHPTADFQELFCELTKTLGIAHRDYPDGSVITPYAPYTKKFLRKRMIQADMEVISLICSVEDHPYRNAYFTDDFDDFPAIASGGRIPQYLGIHGGVHVKIRAANADNGITEKWEIGDLAQSFHHLRTARKRYQVNPTRYPLHKELYWIENGKLELVKDDLVGKVVLPKIPIQNTDDDNAELVLNSPLGYANGVFASCMANLRIVGSDTAHRNDFTAIWGGYVQMILGKELNLPQPERLQRIAS